MMLLLKQVEEQVIEKKVYTMIQRQMSKLVVNHSVALSGEWLYAADNLDKSF